MHKHKFQTEKLFQTRIKEKQSREQHVRPAAAHDKNKAGIIVSTWPIGRTPRAVEECRMMLSRPQTERGAARENRAIRSEWCAA
jgi:hypothetical protein